MAVFRDISKRKKVEEALYASEERFRIAQDTSPDGFTILSPVRNEKGEVVDFTWIYQNRAVGRINGTSPEEVVGKRLLDLFPAHKGTAIFEAYLHVANTGEVKIFEEVYVGEIVSVPTWLRLVIVPMGKDIAILGQNITERKQAEEALSHSHNLMKYIIEHTRSAVAVHDKELRYIYASQRYIDDYKISSDDIIGKHHYEVFPDLPQKWRDVHQRALKGEVLSAEDDPYVREDGSVEWTRWECRPWYEKDESVGGIIIYTEVITERKRTEKELEVFKTISDNSLHGKAIADMNGNLTYVNDYFANIHGFNKEDLIGKNLSVFHNEIQMNEVKRLIGNLIQSGSFAPTEVWHIKSDGTEFPTLMTGVAIKDEIRNTSYLASTLVDITLQKQTQEELFSAKERAEENENKFRAYTEQSPNAIYLTDLNGDCIYVNSKWLEHTGMTYNEAMGKGWINGLYEEDKKKISENWYNSVKSNGKWAFEYRFINKKGEVTWVEGTAKELFNSKGEIAGYLGTNVNITKRKNVENELVLAKERAEESEQRFKALLESAPDGVAVVNAQGKFTYGSPNAGQAFGYTAQDVIGRSGDEFTHPDDLPLVYSALETIMRDPHKKPKVKYRFKHKNGEYRWLETTFTNLLSNKFINGFVLNFSDITEKEQLFEELVIAKNKAEESDRLKSAFLANMSHEIRTPMNGILGFSELLKNPDLTGDAQQKYISIIEKSGKRMLDIINDIIDISRIEAGYVELNMNDSNINEIVEEVLAFFKPEAEAKNIKLFYKPLLPVHEAIIKTDHVKIFAVFNNLVKNAIKFTEKGEIELGSVYKGDFLEFYVKDSGIGVPKDRQEAIFKRFLQADIDDKMARQGAGLGLAISKAYVEMHGGKIWVESEEGKGSVFYFTLPCHAKQKNVSTDQQTVHPVITEDVRKLNILIVDDDEASELLLNESVILFSKEIYKARTGFEAIEACRVHPDIDLILMDIRMPVIDGYEATKQIREFNKEVVIIAQTAYGLLGDREKAMDAGCNDYIAKPIEQDKLLALIKKHFGEQVKS